MQKHRLSVNNVATLIGRKPRTIYSWRSNRVAPPWVIPYLELVLAKHPKKQAPNLLLVERSDAK